MDNCSVVRVSICLSPESAQTRDTANRPHSRGGKVGRKRDPSLLGLRAITHPRAEGPPRATPGSESNSAHQHVMLPPSLAVPPVELSQGLYKGGVQGIRPS